MNNSNDIMTELYKKYYISLVNICNSKGLDRTDSEEVVSEAYYRFWQNIDKLKDLHPLQQRAWLYSATDNIFHEKLRSNIPRTDEDIEDYQGPIISRNDDITKVIEDEAFEFLIESLEKKLTDSEKTALHVLLDVDSGMSYKEISEKRNITISTLTSMTTRFRQHVLSIINEVIYKI